MTTKTNDDTTEEEWEVNTNTLSITTRRTGGGALTGVTCHVNYSETADRSGSIGGLRNRAQAEIAYKVDHGTAILDTIKESGDEGGGVSPSLFHAVPVAEDALLSVPGVEDVERAEETLGGMIEHSREMAGLER